MKILIEESVLRQALEALEMTIKFQDAVTIDGYAEQSTVLGTNITANWFKVRKSITALRNEIDRLEKCEPVAWHGITGDYGFPFLSFQEQPGMTPLYTHPAPAVPNVDCVTCANRGGVYGLSQESNCDHCLWQGHWHKKDLFSEPKPEDI